MSFQPGTEAPQTGIYWCSVCKLPVQFKAGEKMPTCKNLCGRGTVCGSLAADSVDGDLGKSCWRGRMHDGERRG